MDRLTRRTRDNGIEDARLDNRGRWFRVTPTAEGRLSAGYRRAIIRHNLPTPAGFRRRGNTFINTDPLRGVPVEERRAIPAGLAREVRRVAGQRRRQRRAEAGRRIGQNLLRWRNRPIRYRITRETDRNAATLRFRQTHFSVSLDDRARFYRANTEPVRTLLRRIINQGIREHHLTNQDRMSIYLEHPLFHERRRGTFWYYPNQAGRLITDILNWIQQVLQSDERIRLPDITFGFKSLRPLAGGARCYENDLEKRGKLSQGVITVSAEEYCLPISLAVLDAIRRNDPCFNSIRDSRRPFQRRLALQLMAAVGIPVERKIQDFQDIERYATHLGVCIHVIDEDANGSIHHTGNLLEVGAEHSSHFWLRRYKNHFEPVPKPWAYLNRSSSAWCHYCEKGSNNTNEFARHNCVRPRAAQTQPRPPTACARCKKQRAGYHTCCRNCLADTTSNHDHRCFLLRGKPLVSTTPIPDLRLIRQEEDGRFVYDNNRLSTSDKYLLLDIESRVGQNGEHQCVWVDVESLDATIQETFQDIQDFCRWLLQPGKFNGYTILAHYGGGYDFQPILAYLVAHTRLKPEPIYNGCKVITMSIPNLNMRFVDTWRFFMCGLSKLPTMMGFGGAKGYFPHTLNTPENADLRIERGIPDLSCYEPDRCRSEKEKHELIDWHTHLSLFAEHSPGYVYDLRAEMIRYCRQDVNILRQAVLKLRQVFLDAEGIDPFQYPTLPSATMALFRANHMPEESIAYLDYGKDNYSQASVEWITYTEQQLGIEIQSAWRRRGREARVWIDGKPTKVDGLYGKEVYEFHGCLYHGCPKCFPDRTVAMRNGRETVESVYRKTLEKRQRLEEAGYAVHEMWECDWRRQNVCVDLSAVPRPLDPRDAFYGGRTNATKLYSRARPGEKILYKDFRSLYPCIMWDSLYPKGHPTVITQDFDYTLRSYFGIVWCSVVPPKNLYHPVLPARKNGKLVFDLEPKSGAWTTCELLKAIQVGYTISHIRCVHHFEETTTDLFRSYISTFLKIKQEASGYPKWCKTEADRKRYTDDFLRHQGIRLDPADIKKNEALRALAKLCLNNLWGKFGQRAAKSESAWVTRPEQISRLFARMEMNEIENLDLSFVSDTTLFASWNVSDPSPPPHTNVYLAVFTAAHARLKLYSALETAGERVLYFDTDSVIYKIQDSEPDPLPSGDYLGDLEDECDPESDWIEEFVSAGPKNYAYRTREGKTVVKVKGITLDLATRQMITLKKMTAMVRHASGFLTGEAEEMPAPVETSKTRFVLNKHDQSIHTREVVKQYQVVYDKRCVFEIRGDEIDTRPWGHRDLLVC